MAEADKHSVETETFLPSDDFQSAESGLDWDTLANRGNVSLRHSETRWDRDSLYVKFDPLVVPAGSIDCKTPIEEPKCDNNDDEANTTLSPNSFNVTCVEADVSLNKLELEDCSFKTCNNESISESMNSTLEDFRSFNDSNLDVNALAEVDDIERPILDESPYSQKSKRVVHFALDDYNIPTEKLMNGPTSPNDFSNALRMSSSPPTADHSTMCMEDELSSNKTFNVNSLNTPARTALAVNVGLLPQEELNNSNDRSTSLDMSHQSLINSSSSFLDNQKSGASFRSKSSSPSLSFNNSEPEELDECQFQIQHREQICRIAKLKERVAKQDAEYAQAMQAFQLKQAESQKQLAKVEKELKMKRKIYETSLRKKESVIGERECARRILQDAERSFSNLLKMYENSKVLVSNFEKNRETLTTRNNAIEKLLERQDMRHSEAAIKIDSVLELIAVDHNQTIADRLNEKSKLKNKLRMSVLKVQQLESANHQVDHDNDKLRKLCDDLVEA